jgi:hypothetical protein
MATTATPARPAPAYRSVWNKTTLGSQDARTLTDGVSRNADADLFGDACIETDDRIPPTISWDVAPADGALKGGTLMLRVSATDDDSISVPQSQQHTVCGGFLSDYIRHLDRPKWEV